MMTKQLQQAREYDRKGIELIGADERPAFHVTGGVGWINDPNGFSVYRGEYHLFFQYHPYSTHWGPMHWGHVKTKDFVKWEFLPVALAPDTDSDHAGCFSGSAIELPDGRQLLLNRESRRGFAGESRSSFTAFLNATLPSAGGTSQKGILTPTETNFHPHLALCALEAGVTPSEMYTGVSHITTEDGIEQEIPS